MNGNVVTIIVGVLGIVGSVLCSYFFFRRGRSESAEQTEELREMLKDYYQRMAQHRAAPASERAVSKSETGGDDATLSGPAGVTGDEPDAAITELVRASLSVLQDERGAVDLTRLMSEVGRAIGPADLPLVDEVLRRLEVAGDIEWLGERPESSRSGVVRYRRGPRGKVES